MTRGFPNNRVWGGDPSVPPEEDEDPPADEQLMLRQEFITLMYQRFLDGEDGDFDYR